MSSDKIVPGNHSFISDGWFHERNDSWHGFSLALKIDEVLFEGKSDYQDVLVFKSTSFGTVLVLDGVIQCTERDEFTYQEMITHLPMNLHPNPQKVLVVGGGDGGVVRELLKYESVKEVVLCEIDKVVIEVSKKFLPSMASCLSDPRVHINIGDGLEYVGKHQNEFDVIITDSSDSEGVAVGLFAKNFYASLKGALKENGIACFQGDTPFLDLQEIKQFAKECKEVFPSVSYAQGTTPTYISGVLGFLLATSAPNVDFSKPIRQLSKEDLKRMNLRYYNSEIHTSSFALPNYIREELDFLNNS